MNYEQQQTANLLSFYMDEEMRHRREVLQKVIGEMNKKNVVWAVLCSCAFYFRGIVDEYNDYDVLVEEQSTSQFIQIFRELGGSLHFGQNGKEKYFKSREFCYGTLEGIDFDIISGFTITTYNTEYCYDLKENEIEFVRDIPICPVESNLILYGMMIPWQQKRRYKYELAKKYLRESGISQPQILKDAPKNLPKFILEDIDRLLDS